MATANRTEGRELLELVSHARQGPFVLLEDRLQKHSSTAGSRGAGATLFSAPIKIIAAEQKNDIDRAFAAMEQARGEGFYLAGFMTYELGYFLERKLENIHLKSASHCESSPLLWFGVFERATALSPQRADAFLAALRRGPCQVENLHPSMDEATYCQAIEKVRDYITAGDSYQVNYAFKHFFDFKGDEIALYQQLRQRQPVAHGALINTGAHRILSLSPELFIRSEQGMLSTRPMKGTIRRGTNIEEDHGNRLFLQQDLKSKAENLIIVDLLRNDLSRVAEVGSVEVQELFTVETYKSLHQMTSHITARRRKDISTQDLIKNLFPCGSITGAPKIRTMEIIHELEQEARGPYTGSIGCISPEGDSYFNVAIRTLVIDRNNAGEMGIGGGIVYDSNATDEYQECLLKGHFLAGNSNLSEQPDLHLIETLRRDQNQAQENNPLSSYWLLREHLDRLKVSAGFFGYPFAEEEACRCLEQLPVESPLERVRLLLGRDGRVTANATTIDPAAIEASISFCLAGKTVDSGNAFFYHKTTNRAFYESELALQQQQQGCDEVLFINECGEITEGARSNVFVERSGEFYTPPLSCGLLNGILRQHLFNLNYKGITERSMGLTEALSADRIYFGNSVRGLMPARFIPSTP